MRRLYTSGFDWENRNSTMPPFDAVTQNSMRLATKNLDAALATNRRFPEFVFTARWGTVFFFDPDWLFSADSVEIFKALLACENGALVCLKNLDCALDKGMHEDTLFLDKAILGAIYLAQLLGTEPGSGLLYQMDRYGCTSDVGRWCIYCERNNDIAAIAVWDAGATGQFAAPLEALRALPINQAIENPNCFGLTPRGSLDAWRRKLAREYGSPHDLPQES